MNFDEIIQLYKRYKEQYGPEAPKYISQLLREAKEIHKVDWLKSSWLLEDKIQPGCCNEEHKSVFYYSR